MYDLLIYDLIFYQMDAVIQIFIVVIPTFQLSNFQSVVEPRYSYHPNIVNSIHPPNLGIRDYRFRFGIK